MFKKSFEKFHERVDNAFEIMSHRAQSNDGSNSEELWRTSCVGLWKLGTDLEEDEIENDDDDDDENDCLFGDDDDVNNKLGKCDRLSVEEEYDFDDHIACGNGATTISYERRRIKVLAAAVKADFETNPLRYTKYVLDEPVMIGGGIIVEIDDDDDRKRRRKSEREEVPQTPEAEVVGIVEEPRALRGVKRKGDEVRRRRGDGLRKSRNVVSSVAEQSLNEE